MRAGSLFSGVGGFDLGLERAGFEIAFQAEIDPFCQKVLASHWPEVKRYGDVRAVGADRRADPARPAHLRTDGASVGHDERQQPAIDLICGGFPCQDLSVAGKRAGLAGDRSGLWFEFHRILSELRPTFCLIENVPGLLSSNGGRDFGVVLSGLGELWPAVGWAILDSQHFGVPQRRRRVYIIGGPTRASVQQILSLCEGGDWHSQARREAREDTPGPVGGGAYGTGRRSEDDPNLILANPLGAAEAPFGGYRQDLDHDTYIPELSPTLSRRDAKGVSSSADQVAMVAHTLRAKDGTHRTTDAADDNLVVSHSLRADGFDASEDGTGQAVSGASVRRLTPVECERLQGFPDGWTDIDGAKDGPRYKALGNAVTVPVIEYIGRRIAEVLNNAPSTSTKSVSRTPEDDPAMYPIHPYSGKRR